MSKWRNLHWNQRWFLLLLFLCNFFANNDVSLQLCKCPPLWIGEQCEISVLTARKICLPKPTTPNSTNATTTSTTTTTTSTPLFKPQVLTNVDPRCPGAHEYCAEFEGCPDVPADGVCLCQRNYDFVNGTCLKSLFSIYFLFPFSLKKNIFTGAFIGEYCNETFSCYGDSDCIDYRCQCDPYKGLVPRYTQNIDIYYTYCIRAASFQNNTDECFYSTHCKPPMICKNSKCTCPEQNQYYDKNLQTCIWSGLYLHTCSSGQRNQCAGLGPKGKCTGSLCKCGNIANPVPYWYNATEMVNGTVRYMCEAGKYNDDSLKIFSINQLKIFFLTQT